MQGTSNFNNKYTQKRTTLQNTLDSRICVGCVRRSLNSKGYIIPRFILYHSIDKTILIVQLDMSLISVRGSVFFTHLDYWQLIKVCNVTLILFFSWKSMIYNINIIKDSSTSTYGVVQTLLLMVIFGL